MSPDATEPAAVHASHTIPRRYVALALVVVALILLATLIAIRPATSNQNSAAPETLTPAPSSLLATVSQVPATVVNAVGVSAPSSSITSPTATNNPSVWQASSHGVVGLPVVFFYGAEFSPYSAAERWPVVVALSRFGTFGQLGLVQSSSSEAFPDIASFTFWHSRYSSTWVALQSVERYGSEDPSGASYNTLETPDARQEASVTTYDATATTFPLLDIANHYVLEGSSFSPAILAGLSQSQIAADLAYPASPVTQAVMAAANELTAAVCTVTGQRPAAVCSAHGVIAADQKMGIRPGA
jgi:hypothetical protein